MKRVALAKEGKKLGNPRPLEALKLAVAAKPGHPHHAGSPKADHRSASRTKEPAHRHRRSHRAPGGLVVTEVWVIIKAWRLADLPLPRRPSGGRDSLAALPMMRTTVCRARCGCRGGLPN